MRVFCGILLAALLACGGGGGDGYTPPPTAPPPGGGNPNPPPPSNSVTVSMNSADDGYGSESHSFAPTVANVAKDGTVTWTNETGIVHNVTITGSGAPSSIGNFSSGSQSRTFANSGTFNYACTNHEGMTGRVVVP